jgi:hypothetical protein
MDNLVRLRQARSQVVKIQRRLWILQAAFWPVVVLGGILILTVVGRLAWRRFGSAPVVNDAPVTSPAPAQGAQSASTNGHSPSEARRL